eukprot:SAG11_NODE_12474_length_701_cov_1.275748_2_plen_33_part_01
MSNNKTDLQKPMRFEGLGKLYGLGGGEAFVCVV